MAETKQDAAEKALDEVREIRAENEARAATHDRVETHAVVGRVDGDGRSKPVEVHAVGGQVFLNSHGEAVLDQGGVIRLQQALAAAFQAVS